MALYEYTKDGLGYIAGVGIVYKAKVVDSTKCSLNVAADSRFTAAIGGAAATPQSVDAETIHASTPAQASTANTDIHTYCNHA